MRARLRRLSPVSAAIGSTLCFAAMGVCVKTAATRLPIAEVMFGRAVIGTLLVMALMRWEGVSYRAAHLPLLLLRACAGLIAMLCNFYALAHLNLGDATILLNTYPLWAGGMAILFLGERPQRSVFIWIGLAVCGVALIIEPQLQIMNAAGLVALSGAVIIAVAAIAIRKSQAHDSNLRILFYFTATCAVMTAPWALQAGVLPTAAEWGLMLGVGLFASGAQIFQMISYREGRLAHLFPLSYLGVLASFLLGYLFWDEMPGGKTMAGTVIVILCCLCIVRMRGAAPEPPRA